MTSNQRKKPSILLIGSAKLRIEVTRKGLQNLPLREALKATDRLATLVTDAVNHNAELQALGIEILGLAFLAQALSGNGAGAGGAGARADPAGGGRGDLHPPQCRRRAGASHQGKRLTPIGRSTRS